MNSAGRPVQEDRIKRELQKTKLQLILKIQDVSEITEDLDKLARALRAIGEIEAVGKDTADSNVNLSITSTKEYIQQLCSKIKQNEKKQNP